MGYVDHPVLLPCGNLPTLTTNGRSYTNCESSEKEPIARLSKSDLQECNKPLQPRYLTSERCQRLILPDLHVFRVVYARSQQYVLLVWARAYMRSNKQQAKQKEGHDGIWIMGMISCPFQVLLALYVS
jgi:hypothetical protein